MLNHITWNECAAFEHAGRVTSDTTVMFTEVRDDSAGDAEQLPHDANAASAAEPNAAAARWRYEVQEAPVEVRLHAVWGLHRQLVFLTWTYRVRST